MSVWQVDNPTQSGPVHCPDHPQTDAGIKFGQNYKGWCYWDSQRGEWLERGAGIAACLRDDHPWPNRADTEEEWE